MKIGIVGWGVEGQSAYLYFGPEHDYLIVSEEPRDDFPSASDKIKIQFNSSKRPVGTTSNAADLSYLAGLEDCDKIVYSPTSIKNLEEYFGENKAFWEKATTGQRIFFEEVKTKNIIGVTGTKGKGTTSTLIAKLLEAQGKKVHLGGNIGRSVLDFVGDVGANDWVVLELSSFQLYKFPYSPHVAVCLLIVPEHMDWHSNMDEYANSKSNIFKHQKTDDIAIYFAQNDLSKQMAQLSPGKKVSYYQKPGAYVRDDGMIVIGENEQEIIGTTEVKLLGKHNLQNICAACTAVYEALGSLDSARSVLSSFGGLEHRLELVRELEGVKYYDDSFGTTPQSAIVALEAFTQPKVLIVGGYDRGIDMQPIVDEIIKQDLKFVVTMGQTGKTVAKKLKHAGFSNLHEDAKDMPSAVEAARAGAGPGDVVLLSAAATSFDMFKDFAERGNQFKSAVNNL